MSDENSKETLATLDSLKPGSTIAITADLANESPASICRIAIAWISGADVYSVAYYAKPPTDDFSASRKITAEMVADCDSFADVWDNKVLPLLKTNLLSAYRPAILFPAIKASYEDSGRPFIALQFFVRDLGLLARTYMPDLGNDSLPSIAHKMNLTVDLDSAISRAMACVTAVDWLEGAYPDNSYGIPLAFILGGVPLPSVNDMEAQVQAEAPRGVMQYSRHGLGFFIFVCMMAAAFYVGYYVQHNMNEEKDTPQMEQSTQNVTVPDYDLSKAYTMSKGTFIVKNETDIQPFMTAAQRKDTASIRSMVRKDQVIVMADKTTIKVTGKSIDGGFIPVTITQGNYSGTKGYAPFNMIDDK